MTFCRTLFSHFASLLLCFIGALLEDFLESWSLFLTHEHPWEAGDGNSEGKHEEEDEEHHRPGDHAIIHLKICAPLKTRWVYFCIFALDMSQT